MIQTHHVNYFYGKSYCVFNNVTFNNIMVCYTNLACLIKNVISVPFAVFLSCFYYVLPGMTGGTLCFSGCRVIRPSFFPSVTL